MSITTSACERSSSSLVRSRSIPSTMRSFPCNGCGRRVDSKRCTSDWSVASKNSKRYAAPLDCRVSSALFKASKNFPPRTSTTTARDAISELLACDASSGNSAGGKLSTTYQPRSSRACATVDRPAPDIPVTINNSLLAMATLCLHCQGTLNS